MSRTSRNPLVAESAVSVEKVEKIEPVYKPESRPSVCPNLSLMTMVATPPAAVSSRMVLQRALSKEEIDAYISTKKKQFAGDIPQYAAC